MEFILTLLHQVTKERVSRFCIKSGEIARYMLDWVNIAVVLFAIYSYFIR